MHFSRLIFLPLFQKDHCRGILDLIKSLNSNYSTLCNYVQLSGDVITNVEFDENEGMVTILQDLLDKQNYEKVLIVTDADVRQNFFLDDGFCRSGYKQSTSRYSIWRQRKRSFSSPNSAFASISDSTERDSIWRPRQRSHSSLNSAFAFESDIATSTTKSNTAFQKSNSRIGNNNMPASRILGFYQVETTDYPRWLILAGDSTAPHIKVAMEQLGIEPGATAVFKCPRHGDASSSALGYSDQNYEMDSALTSLLVAIGLMGPQSIVGNDETDRMIRNTAEKIALANNTDAGTIHALKLYGYSGEFQQKFEEYFKELFSDDVTLKGITLSLWNRYLRIESTDGFDHRDHKEVGRFASLLMKRGVFTGFITFLGKHTESAHMRSCLLEIKTWKFSILELFRLSKCVEKFYKGILADVYLISSKKKVDHPSLAFLRGIALAHRGANEGNGKKCTIMLTESKPLRLGKTEFLPDGWDRVLTFSVIKPTASSAIVDVKNSTVEFGTVEVVGANSSHKYDLIPWNSISIRKVATNVFITTGDGENTEYIILGERITDPLYDAISGNIIQDWNALDLAPIFSPEFSSSPKSVKMVSADYFNDSGFKAILRRTDGTAAKLPSIHWYYILRTEGEQEFKCLIGLTRFRIDSFTLFDVIGMADAPYTLTVHIFSKSVSFSGFDFQDKSLRTALTDVTMGSVIGGIGISSSSESTFSKLTLDALMKVNERKIDRSDSTVNTVRTETYNPNAGIEIQLEGISFDRALLSSLEMENPSIGQLLSSCFPASVVNSIGKLPLALNEQIQWLNWKVSAGDVLNEAEFIAPLVNAPSLVNVHSFQFALDVPYAPTGAVSSINTLRLEMDSSRSNDLICELKSFFVKVERPRFGEGLEGTLELHMSAIIYRVEQAPSSDRLSFEASINVTVDTSDDTLPVLSLRPTKVLVDGLASNKTRDLISEDLRILIPSLEEDWDENNHVKAFESAGFSRPLNPRLLTTVVGAGVSPLLKLRQVAPSDKTVRMESLSFVAPLHSLSDVISASLLPSSWPSSLEKVISTAEISIILFPGAHTSGWLTRGELFFSLPIPIAMDTNPTQQWSLHCSLAAWSQIVNADNISQNVMQFEATNALSFTGREREYKKELEEVARIIPGTFDLPTLFQSLSTIGMQGLIVFLTNAIPTLRNVSNRMTLHRVSNDLRRVSNEKGSFETIVSGFTLDLFTPNFSMWNDKIDVDECCIKISQTKTTVRTSATSTCLLGHGRKKSEVDIRFDADGSIIDQSISDSLVGQPQVSLVFTNLKDFSVHEFCETFGLENVATVPLIDSLEQVTLESAELLLLWSPFPTGNNSQPQVLFSTVTVCLQNLKIGEIDMTNVKLSLSNSRKTALTHDLNKSVGGDWSFTASGDFKGAICGSIHYANGCEEVLIEAYNQDDSSPIDDTFSSIAGKGVGQVILPPLEALPSMDKANLNVRKVTSILNIASDPFIQQALIKVGTSRLPMWGDEIMLRINGDITYEYDRTPRITGEINGMVYIGSAVTLAVRGTRTEEWTGLSTNPLINMSGGLVSHNNTTLDQLLVSACNVCGKTQLLIPGNIPNLSKESIQAFHLAVGAAYDELNSHEKQNKFHLARRELIVIGNVIGSSNKAVFDSSTSPWTINLVGTKPVQLWDLTAGIHLTELSRDNGETETEQEGFIGASWRLNECWHVSLELYLLENYQSTKSLMMHGKLKTREGFSETSHVSVSDLMSNDLVDIMISANEENDSESNLRISKLAPSIESVSMKPGATFLWGLNDRRIALVGNGGSNGEVRVSVAMGVEQIEGEEGEKRDNVGVLMSLQWTGAGTTLASACKELEPLVDVLPVGDVRAVVARLPSDETYARLSQMISEADGSGMHLVSPAKVQRSKEEELCLLVARINWHTGKPLLRAVKFLINFQEEQDIWLQGIIERKESPLYSQFVGEVPDFKLLGGPIFFQDAVLMYKNKNDIHSDSKNQISNVTKEMRCVGRAKILNTSFSAYVSVRERVDSKGGIIAAIWGESSDSLYLGSVLTNLSLRNAVLQGIKEFHSNSTEDLIGMVDLFLVGEVNITPTVTLPSAILFERFGNPRVLYASMASAHNGIGLSKLLTSLMSRGYIAWPSDWPNIILRGGWFYGCNGDEPFSPHYLPLSLALPKQNDVLSRMFSDSHATNPIEDGAAEYSDLGIEVELFVPGVFAMSTMFFFGVKFDIVLSAYGDCFTLECYKPDVWTVFSPHNWLVLTAPNAWKEPNFMVDGISSEGDSDEYGPSISMQYNSSTGENVIKFALGFSIFHTKIADTTAEYVKNEPNSGYVRGSFKNLPFPGCRSLDWCWEEEGAFLLTNFDVTVDLGDSINFAHEIMALTKSTKYDEMVGLVFNEAITARLDTKLSHKSSSADMLIFEATGSCTTTISGQDLPPFLMTRDNKPMQLKLHLSSDGHFNDFIEALRVSLVENTANIVIAMMASEETFEALLSVLSSTSLVDYIQDVKHESDDARHLRRKFEIALKESANFTSSPAASFDRKNGMFEVSWGACSFVKALKLDTDIEEKWSYKVQVSISSSKRSSNDDVAFEIHIEPHPEDALVRVYNEEIYVDALKVASQIRVSVQATVTLTLKEHDEIRTYTGIPSLPAVFGQRPSPPKSVHLMYDETRKRVLIIVFTEGDMENHAVSVNMVDEYHYSLGQDSNDIILDAVSMDALTVNKIKRKFRTRGHLFVGELNTSPLSNENTPVLSRIFWQATIINRSTQDFSAPVVSSNPLVLLPQPRNVSISEAGRVIPGDTILRATGEIFQPAFVSWDASYSTPSSSNNVPFTFQVLPSVNKDHEFSTKPAIMMPPESRKMDLSITSLPSNEETASVFTLFISSEIGFNSADSDAVIMPSDKCRAYPNIMTLGKAVANFSLYRDYDGFRERSNCWAIIFSLDTMAANQLRNRNGTLLDLHKQYVFQFVVALRWRTSKGTERDPDFHSHQQPVLPVTDREREALFTNNYEFLFQAPSNAVLVDARITSQMLVLIDTESFNSNHFQKGIDQAVATMERHEVVISPIIIRTPVPRKVQGIKMKRKNRFDLTSAQIYWDRGSDDDEIESYTLVVSNQNDGDILKRYERIKPSSGINQLTISVEDFTDPLAPNERYHISIFCENRQGISLGSEPLVVQMKRDNTFALDEVDEAEIPIAAEDLTMSVKTTVPVLRWKNYTFWAYSFIDNREAFQIIMMDYQYNIMKQWYKPGARYLEDIVLDLSKGIVTFVGQSGKNVHLSLEEIEATFFVLKVDKVDAPPDPSGLKIEGATTLVLKWKDYTFWAYSFIDEREAFQIIMYDADWNICREWFKPGTCDLEDIVIDTTSRIASFVGKQGQKADLSLREIESTFFVSTADKNEAPPPPKGLKLEAPLDTPLLKWRDYTFWAYSYIDNRVAFQIVMYDFAGNIVREWYKPGANCLEDVILDTAKGCVFFVGKDGNNVSLSLQEIEDMFFVLAVDKSDAPPAPTSGLAMIAPTTVPVLKWRDFTFWAYSYKDKREAFKIIMYDAFGTNIREWDKPGARCLKAVALNMSLGIVSFIGSGGGKADLSLRDIEATYFVLTVDKSNAFPPPRGLKTTSSFIVPFVKWKEYTFWAYGFVDNRDALQIIMIDAGEQIKKEWYKPGARYLKDIIVDSSERVISFIGEGSSKVNLHFTEISDAEKMQDEYGSFLVSEADKSDAPPTPKGLKLSASSNIPILRWKDYTFWAYSFVDNRVAFQIIVCDANKNIVKEFYKPGARYLKKVSLDTDAGIVEFIGQGVYKVELSLKEIESTFFVIKMEKSDAPPVPIGLKLVAPSSAPVLRWKDYTFWAYSFTDDREAFQIIMFDSNGNIVKEWYKPGARYLTDISFDSSNETVTFLGQNGNKVYLAMRDIFRAEQSSPITESFSVSKANKSLAPVPAEGLKMSAPAEVPVLRYKNYTLWAYSFIDKREALKIIMYDTDGVKQREWYKPGARYLEDLVLNVSLGYASFIGRDGNRVSLSLRDIEASFLVLKMDKSHAPPPLNGLKMIAPTLVPLLVWKEYTFWAYSFTDKREAFQIIMYDTDWNIQREWYKPGARYLEDVKLDSTSGIAIFTGQRCKQVELSLREIESTFFILTVDNREVPRAPTGLSLIAPAQVPLLKWKEYTFWAYSFDDNREAFQIIMCDIDCRKIREWYKPGAKYLEDIVLDTRSGYVFFVGQGDKSVCLALREIEATFFVDTVNRNDLPPAPSGLTMAVTKEQELFEKEARQQPDPDSPEWYDLRISVKKRRKKKVIAKDRMKSKSKSGVKKRMDEMLK